VTGWAALSDAGETGAGAMLHCCAWWHSDDLQHAHLAWPSFEAKHAACPAAAHMPSKNMGTHAGPAAIPCSSAAGKQAEAGPRACVPECVDE
jgi:hypothetical protein